MIRGGRIETENLMIFRNAAQMYGNGIEGDEQDDAHQSQAKFPVQRGRFARQCSSRASEGRRHSAQCLRKQFLIGLQESSTAQQNCFREEGK
jgi:hypothetical protein